MLTNAQIMVSLRFHGRLRKYLKLVVVNGTLKGDNNKAFESRFTCVDVTKTVNGMMDALIENTEFAVAESSALFESKVAIETAVNELKVRFPTLFPINKVKKRWCEYLPLLHFISRIFEAHITDRRSSDLKCMRGIGLFSMLPLANFKAKHIRLDTMGLQEALKFLGMGWEGNIWQRYFLPSIGGDRERRKFSGMIDTDGVSVSIHFEKPGRNQKSEEEVEPKFLTIEAAESAYAKETKRSDAAVIKANIPNDIERTIYVDPGGTTMASCVLEGDCKEQKQTVECRTAEYRHLASFDKLQRKRNNLIKSSGLEDVVTQLPSPRVSSVHGFKHHILELFTRFEEILDHYGSKKRRNISFTAFSRSEKAMETMVKRIAPKDVKTLVVYGAADFPHAMKGTVATPYKKLRDRVKGRSNVTFVSVGECNTSQRCCRCQRAIENVVGEKVRAERVCRVPTPCGQSLSQLFDNMESRYERGPEHPNDLQNTARRKREARGLRASDPKTM